MEKTPKTPPAPKHKPGTDCIVCGKVFGAGCRCPWHEPFEFWPTVLIDTVRLVCDGGPFAGS